VDFWDLTKVALRRWYVAIPLLVLTAAASFWTYEFVTPDYKATAYIVLVPPTETGTDPADSLRNPYLELGLTALNQAASTVTKDQTFLEELTKSGLSDNITIEEGYPAPIATIEVIAGSKELASLTLTKVVNRFNETVQALQIDARAKANSLITTKRLGADNLEETGGKVKRAMIGVFAAGLLMTAAITIAFDTVARRRRSRRTGPHDMQPVPLPAVLPSGARFPTPGGLASGSLPFVVASPHAFRQSLPDESANVAFSAGSSTVGSSRPAPSAVVPSTTTLGTFTTGQAHDREERSGDTDLPKLPDAPVLARDMPGEHDATVILPLSVPESGRQNRNGGTRS
jgi:capsular polysaccharide biosynthesis protein